MLGTTQRRAPTSSPSVGSPTVCKPRISPLSSRSGKRSSAETSSTAFCDQLCPLPSRPCPPCKVGRYASQDDGEGEAGVPRLGHQRVQYHADGCQQKEHRHQGVAPRPVRTRQVWPAATKHEDGADGQRVEGPDSQDELVGELLEIVQQHIYHAKAGG